MSDTRKCLTCNSPIQGRVDKIFCSPYCKTSYHYQSKKRKENTLFKIIDQQLKLNRHLLKHFNQSGVTTIRKIEITSKGFNPKYFTHYWKNPKGEVYLFCYEFGFLSKKIGGINKYVLVQWQNYMDKS